MKAAEILPGDDASLLLLCDHASAWVPNGIDIPHALLGRHVAYDIGAAALTRRLAARLGVPAILGTVSRLVIDLHRQPDHPSLVPVTTDGHSVPRNVGANIEERIRRFHAPYHTAIRDHIRTHLPRLVISLHSYTPRLESDGRERPWEVGILYGRMDRAALLAIAHLRGLGLRVGDNEPYSGHLLNATLDRHADGQGIPSVLVEVRNDQIGDHAGTERWAGTIDDMIDAVRNGLALKGGFAT